MAIDFSRALAATYVVCREQSQDFVISELQSLDSRLLDSISMAICASGRDYVSHIYAGHYACEPDIGSPRLRAMVA